jgi:hypothetical protein
VCRRLNIEAMQNYERNLAAWFYTQLSATRKYNNFLN